MRQLSQLDNSQIVKHQFDEENSSQRVTIVAGAMPEMKLGIDTEAITQAVQKGLEGFKLESSQVVTHIQRVEVPVIVKEYEKVEVPVITKEIEYREINIPVITEKIKFVEVEKTVILKEYQVVKEDTLETKYLRIACVCLIVLELLTLMLKLR